MPCDDPVLASDPVEWIAEFRFFIHDRLVKASSPYWLRGAPARSGDEWIVEPEMESLTRRLVERLLQDSAVDIPEAAVIDAGIIAGFGPAIVEANEAAGSGIYGCDPSLVLEVLRAGTRIDGSGP